MQFAKKMTLVPFQEEPSRIFQSGMGHDDISYDSDESDQEGYGLPDYQDAHHISNNTKGNSIRKYAHERQRKMFSVILKLAAYGGYDTTGRIKLKDGTFMERSDIISLLMYSLSPGRSVKGITEFVDLLHAAGVHPDEVINLNVRELLRKSSI